jgi:hypothetical protein
MMFYSFFEWFFVVCIILYFQRIVKSFTEKSLKKEKKNGARGSQGRSGTGGKIARSGKDGRTVCWTSKE